MAALRLLQSLDDDNDPSNGIVITPALTDTLKTQNLNFTNTPSNTDLGNLLQAAGKTLISEDDAKAHYEETLRSKLNLSVDTVPPIKPKSADRLVSNSGTQNLIVTGEPGAAVLINGVKSQHIIGQDRKAIVPLTATQVNQDNTFDITLQDEKGQTSQSKQVVFNFDQVAPNTPVFVSSPKTLTNQTNLNVTITGEPATQVLNGQTLLDTIPDSGELSLSLPLEGADGVKSFNLVSKDLAGNESTPLRHQVTKDTNVDKPNATFSAYSNKALETLNIQGEALSEVFINGTSKGTLDANGQLNAEFDIAGEDGDKTFEISLKDPAGNTSGALSGKIIKDTVVPVIKSITGQPIATNLDKTTGIMSGEPGTKVYFKGNETPLGEIGQDGNFQLELNLPGIDGLKNFEIVTRDLAGNESAVNSIAITKDTVAPIIKGIKGQPIATNLDKTSGILSGEPGTKVYFKGNETPLGEIGQDGNFQLDLTLAGDDGLKNFEVITKDLAGNESAVNTLTITKDTVAPVEPKINNMPIATNSDTINIVINGEAGTEVLDSTSSTLLGVIGNDGTLDLSLPLSGEGQQNFSFNLKDLAGNTSTITKVATIRDTIAPSQPTVSSIASLVDGKLPVTIAGEPDTTIISNGIEIGKIALTGITSINLEDPQSNHYELFNIALQDLAGNLSSINPFITTFQRQVIGTEKTYFVPKDVTVVQPAAAGEEAVIMSYSSGSSAEVVGGAVAKLEIPSTQSAENYLSSLISSLNALTDIQSINNLTLKPLQTTTLESVVGTYTLNTSSKTASVDLVSSIVGDILSGQVSIPSASSGAVNATEFSFNINLEKAMDGKVYIAISVVPKTEYFNFKTIVESITNTQNISNNNAVISNATDTFDITTDKVNLAADFLFMVDDSGSMSSYQNAISAAGESFANAIQNAGINFRAAILTTSTNVEDSSCTSTYSSHANRVICSTGIIDNDVNQLKQELVVGTRGSGTETGIYNSEYSLLSTNLGDAVDGILTAKGMPLTNETPMFVIILSDEPSQYSSRNYGSTFDVNNNLFVNRGFKVFAIVEPDTTSYYYGGNGQYDELATATGGLTADINNTSEYSQIMDTIAQTAAGSSGLKLSSEGVLETTMQVKIDGTLIDNIAVDGTNGWKYLPLTNTILFYGNKILKAGNQVEITYSYE